MSLSSLATVELQLVMHACDLHTLLSFARCSRTLLTAASCGFAWQRLSPLPVRSCIADLSARLSSSLLRFADIHLLCSHAEPVEWRRPVVTYDEVDDILALSRLRGLDCRPRGAVAIKHLQRMLQHPAMSGLQQLHVRDHALVSQRLLATLPLHQSQMHTLTCSTTVDGDLTPLTLMPQLTCLNLVACDSSDLQPVAQCRALRTLSLQSCCVSALLASPNMQSLHSLRLRLITVDADQLSFAHLRGLQSLHIDLCTCVDALLTAAAEHCVELQSLHVRFTIDVGPRAFPIDPRIDSQQPSVSVLAATLSRLPRLAQLVLEFPAQQSLLPTLEADAAVRQQMAQQWQAKHDAFVEMARESKVQVRFMLM